MRSYHHLHGAGGLLIAVGEQGQIRHFTGAAFEARPTPTQADLLCAWVHDQDHAWAAGRRGTLLAWNGASWTALDSGTREDLHALWAADPDNLWAGGTGSLLRLCPGGAGAVLRLCCPGFTVHAIWGSGPADVWCLGQTRTLIHWDGQGWRYLPLPDDEADRRAFRYGAGMLLHGKAAEMPEERFFSLVAELGWGRTTDYRAIGAALARRLPVMDLLAMDRQFSRQRHRVGTHIERWERETGNHVEVSDDGMLDLTSHIVGLGQKEVEAVLADPSLAARRAAARDYTESFAYVFHCYDEGYSAEELAQALRAHGAPRPYAPAQGYRPGEALDHPELGPGIVGEQDPLQPGLVQVLFAGGGRLLPLQLREEGDSCRR